MKTPPRRLRLSQPRLGNVIMALSAMIGALAGLREAGWWWTVIVAVGWLIGYGATQPLGLSARSFPLVRVALLYAASLIGTTICYALGLLVRAL
jgi:hypothetical protein